VKRSTTVSLGIIIGLLVTLLGLTIFLKIKAGKYKRALIHSEYTKDSFRKPEGLRHEATQSAQITPKKINIITYHYVEYVEDPNDTTRKSLDINPHLFEGHLKNLQKNGYQTDYVKNIPDILDGKLPYASRSAFLTFDDGYEDFYTVVLPLLKKYDMKATIYVISDYIGRRGFLNESELKEIVASNRVEIGAHTLDHLGLKGLRPALARHQVTESKQKLEQMLGIEVKTLAYPYGSFDQQAIDITKEASFSAAVSVIPGTIQSKDNLFYLSRLRAGMFSENNMTTILENMKK